MPSEVNIKTQTGEADPVPTDTGPAPNLTPTQVPQSTGHASSTTAEILPKRGTETPATSTRPTPPSADPKGSQPAGTEQSPAVDAAAVFKLVKNLPPGELDTLIAAVETELKNASLSDSEDVDLDEPSTSPSTASGGDSDSEVGYDRLDIGSQKAIRAVHSHMVDLAIAHALDSDGELSYNMKQASPKIQESVKSIVRDRLQQLVDKQGGRFNYNWGAAAQQAVATEKARLAPFFERPARPGMGPGSHTDFQVNRELKAPERVPAFASDREYDEYLIEKMRYNQALAEREQSNTLSPGA